MSEEYSLDYTAVLIATMAGIGMVLFALAMSTVLAPRSKSKAKDTPSDAPGTGRRYLYRRGVPWPDSRPDRKGYPRPILLCSCSLGGSTFEFIGLSCREKGSSSNLPFHQFTKVMVDGNILTGQAIAINGDLLDSFVVRRWRTARVPAGSGGVEALRAGLDL